MKAVKGKLPADRVETFEKGAQAFAKKIVANFKDYEFVGAFFYSPVQTPTFKQFTGEGMNPDGMVALLNYRVCFILVCAMNWAHKKLSGGWCYT